MVRAVLAGQSRREAARSFEISASCVIKLMQQWETTGNCLPRKFVGHKRHALAEHEDKVRALVAAQPDLTIMALWRKLMVLDIKVGRSIVSFLLDLNALRPLENDDVPGRLASRSHHGSLCL